MSRCIGIDLGTTNCCVVVLEGNSPVVIPNSEGSRTTPSMVAFTEDGERLVGMIAKRQVVTNPERTIFAVKRLIGRKFNSPELQRVKAVYPYQIVAAANGDAVVELEGRQYSPTEVSSYLLAKMKQTAEEYLGEEVSEAVITVPAYFDDAQRQATRDSGKIAGLEVRRIINEPTAAALAYGLESGGQEGLIAVYDLGGGTFDISILNIRHGLFEVKSTTGDSFLGGEDFDIRIIDYLAQQFEDKEGIDLREEVIALQRLKEGAEKAKFELSSSQETQVNLPFIAADVTGPKHLNVPLTRLQLEALVEDLIERTLEYCELALEEAGLVRDEITAVVLVGGMTKMPHVQRKVLEFFGDKIVRSVNPDEAVAIGAALQAGIATGASTDVLLLDVLPLSLGVETSGGVFTKLIEKNSSIPTAHGEVFSTATDNQSIVNVHVLQGERPMARDNKSLARFQLLDIPPAPRGVPQIEVSFEVDVDGLLHVSAKDLGTNKEKRVRVSPSSGLTELEIERLVQEADEYRDKDVRVKEMADLKNSAEALIYTAGRAAAEFGDILDAAELEKLKSSLDSCQRALDDEGARDSLQEAMSALEEISYRLTEKVYGRSS